MRRKKDKSEKIDVINMKLSHGKAHDFNTRDIDNYRDEIELIDGAYDKIVSLIQMNNAILLEEKLAASPFGGACGMYLTYSIDGLPIEIEYVAVPQTYLNLEIIIPNKVEESHKLLEKIRNIDDRFSVTKSYRWIKHDVLPARFI